MIEQINLQATPKRHSRLGIVSTVIGLLLPILLVFCLAVAFSLDAKKNTIGNDIVAASLLITLTFPVVHLIALVLGIVSLCFKNTKKLFPITGTILNAILLLAGIGIFFLALKLFSAATAFR